MALVESPRLFVRELELPAHIGIYPSEQEVVQQIRLTISVGLEHLNVAVHSGKLRDTLDYNRIAQTAIEVVGRQHYRLVENLAYAIGESLLRLAPVTWVRVRIDKLGCIRQASAAGVELTVERDADARVVRSHPSPLPQPPSGGAEEVIIIGGGVAGLTAALWIGRLGHTALLIDDGPLLGGQLHQIYRPMPDIPGTAPVDGRTFAERMWKQFRDNGGRWMQTTVTRIRQDASRSGYTIDVGTSERPLTAQAIVLTPGLSRNRLGVPGEKEFLGRGLLHTAAREIDALDGSRVVVVGGGDAACENALRLAEAGAVVTLVHRGPILSAREQFRSALQKHQRIMLRFSTHVRAFLGEDRLERVALRSGGGEAEIFAEAALVRIGWHPNVEPLPERWLSADGYIRVARSGQVIGERSAAAAGDAAEQASLSVAGAMGSAVTAARTICAALEEGVGSHA